MSSSHSGGGGNGVKWQCKYCKFEIPNLSPGVCFLHCPTCTKKQVSDNEKGSGVQPNGSPGSSTTEVPLLETDSSLQQTDTIGRKRPLPAEVLSTDEKPGDPQQQSNKEQVSTTNKKLKFTVPQQLPSNTEKSSQAPNSDPWPKFDHPASPKRMLSGTTAVIHSQLQPPSEKGNESQALPNGKAEDSKPQKEQLNGKAGDSSPQLSKPPDEPEVQPGVKAEDQPPASEPENKLQVQPNGNAASEDPCKPPAERGNKPEMQQAEDSPLQPPASEPENEPQVQPNGNPSSRDSPFQPSDSKPPAEPGNKPEMQPSVRAEDSSPQTSMPLASEPGNEKQQTGDSLPKPSVSEPSKQPENTNSKAEDFPAQPSEARDGKPIQQNLSTSPKTKAKNASKGDSSSGDKKKGQEHSSSKQQQNGQSSSTSVSFTCTKGFELPVVDPGGE